MTTSFTASNGIEIEISEDGYLLGKGDYGSGPTYATAGPEGIDALREYLQHERDAELGRWRDPENANMVVYPYSADEVWVLNEIDCASIPCRRGTFVQAAIEIGDEDTFPMSDYDRAAARYFTANPEPKPWHDALPGEAWLLTIDGAEEPATVGYSTTPGVRKFYVGSDTFDLTDPGITGGRRLYPEEGTTK